MVGIMKRRGAIRKRSLETVELPSPVKAKRGGQVGRRWTQRKRGEIRRDMFGWLRLIAQPDIGDLKSKNGKVPCVSFSLSSLWSLLYLLISFSLSLTCFLSLLLSLYSLYSLIVSVLSLLSHCLCAISLCSFIVSVLSLLSYCLCALSLYSLIISVLSLLALSLSLCSLCSFSLLLSLLCSILLPLPVLSVSLLVCVFDLVAFVRVRSLSYDLSYCLWLWSLSLLVCVFELVVFVRVLSLYYALLFVIVSACARSLCSFSLCYDLSYCLCLCVLSLLLYRPLFSALPSLSLYICPLVLAFVWYVYLLVVVCCVQLCLGWLIYCNIQLI